MQKDALWHVSQAVRQARRDNDMETLRGLKAAIAKLQDKVKKGIREVKLAKYEVRARQNLEPVKRQFFEGARVGDVIAVWHPDWLWPDAHYSVDWDADGISAYGDYSDHDEPDDDDRGDDRGDDGDASSWTSSRHDRWRAKCREGGRWGVLHDRPWLVQNSVTVLIRNIAATTKNVGGFDFEVDCLCDHFCGEFSVVDDHDDEFPIGSRYMNAVRSACWVLVHNTKLELARTFSVWFVPRIDTGLDYVQGTVDMEVRIDVFQRRYMSVARVGWMMSVIRGMANLATARARHTKE
jgi:hypothetical protein